MISILLDCLGAYLIAKKTKNIPILIGFSIAAGLMSDVIGNLAIQFFTLETAGATMSRIAGGLFWHPAISIIAALFFRWKFSRQIISEIDNAEKLRRRELTLAAQREMEEKKRRVE